MDDALRARATEFYTLELQGKYRQAEALVAEGAKDDYYAAPKDYIKGFRIDQINYSDNYTKAKLQITVKTMVSFMGMAAPQLMDVPFPSFWKIENGKWCFYYYVDPERMTPFGKQKNPNAGSGGGKLEYKPMDLSTLGQGVKADKSVVKLGEIPEKIVLTNTLQGTVTISLDQKEYPGMEVKLDKQELKGGETATITVTPKSPVGRPRLMVGVIVQPTNQFLRVEIR